MRERRKRLASAKREKSNLRPRDSEDSKSIYNSHMIRKIVNGIRGEEEEK